METPAIAGDASVDYRLKLGASRLADKFEVPDGETRFPSSYHLRWRSDFLGVCSTKRLEVRLSVGLLVLCLFRRVILISGVSHSGYRHQK